MTTRTYSMSLKTLGLRKLINTKLYWSFYLSLDIQFCIVVYRICQGGSSLSNSSHTPLALHTTPDFFVPKFVWLQTFVDPNKPLFTSQIFDPNFFWPQLFWPNIFWPNIFGPNIFWPQLFLTPKILVPNFFWICNWIWNPLSLWAKVNLNV